MPVQHHRFMEAVKPFDLGPKDINQMFRTPLEYASFLDHIVNKMRTADQGLPDSPEGTKTSIRNTVGTQSRITAWKTEPIVIFTSDPDVLFIPRSYSPIRKIPDEAEIFLDTLVSFLIRFILEMMMKWERKLREAGEQGGNMDLLSHKTLAIKVIRDGFRSGIPAGFKTTKIVRDARRVAGHRFAPRSGDEIHILQGPDAVHVGVHESMHFTSSRKFGDSFGHDFDEAATEYFARTALYEGDPIDQRGAYPMLIDILSALIQVRAIRADDLVEAYFNGNTVGMERTLRRFFSDFIFSTVVKGDESLLKSAMIQRMGYFRDHPILNKIRLLQSYVWD